ncbi:MAG TPA: helix-turn-helix transcriptional regulator [Streptosporangiaceae bacterium]|nr:helix-turn-helix transcriptional regulator [Streptosporangiaceae bacterium]
MSARSLALDRVGALMGRLSSAALGLQEYAATAMPALERAVGFDGWCMDLADPDSSLPVAVAYGHAPLGDRLPQFWRFEFEHSGPGAADHPRVLAAAARHDAPGVRRFAELLRPGGVADELRCWFVVDRISWGALCLFRSEGGRRFTDADAEAMTSVLLPFATGARRAWVSAAPPGGNADSAEPGTLLFGRSGALISQTPAARHWLGQLDASYSMILATLAMLETRPSASLRTRTATGMWLRLSGGRLVPQAGDAAVAITIQPAAPTEIAPLLMRAYDLTPRQRAVARLVLAGQSSQQIAAALHVSHHTVNDHVRAIADKTGVRSRGQLAAALTGLPLGASNDHERYPESGA